MLKAPLVGTVAVADCDATAFRSAISLRSRVARSLFWIAWSRGALQVVSFATTVLVARILVPADYGVMAIAGIWTTSVGMLAEMGLGAAIIQFRELDRREIDTCFWITMTLALFGYGALWAGSPTIARWFAVPRLADVLPVLGLVLPVTASRVVSDSLLRKRLALDRVSQAEIIGGVVTLPVMAGCALAGFGIWTLVIGALVGPSVRSAATIALAPWRPGMHIGGERIGRIVRFSLATLGVRAFWVLRESADELVVGKFTGQLSVGFYSMAKELALLPTTKISTVVNMLSSPMMAELQTNINAMRAEFLRSVRITAAIAVPSSAGIALVAPEIVNVMLGPKWLPTVPIIRLLSVYAAVRAVDVLLPPVLFARHRDRFLFWYCLALLVAMPASAVIGALWGGVSGVIFFSTPVYCAVMAVMAHETLTELDTSFSALWAETRSTVIATATMAVAVLSFREAGTAGAFGPSVVTLIVLTLVGAVTYLAALLVLRSPVISDGVTLVRWLLPRSAS